MVRMAIPIAAGFVGIMLMNTVDLICVGRLGALEMASVGLGNIFWTVIFMPGLGTSIGLEFPVSFNFGAKRHTECRRVFIQGLWIVTIYSALMLVLPQFLVGPVQHFVADKKQAQLAGDYFAVTLWGIWPALIFTVLRVYLQALGRVSPAFYVLFLANIVNLVLDLALVLGWWGFPKWEVYGAAVATNIARYFMMFSLLGYVVATDARLRVMVRTLRLHPSKRRMMEILKIGLPSGLQVTFEGGVFSLSTLLAATFDVVSSAAHQAVLNLASNAFMVPLGISSAAAVMVGQSYGSRNATDLKRAGRLGFQIVLVWMVFTSGLFLIFPKFFLGWYITDTDVLNTGAGLMLVTAAFQISDGIQVVGTGVLRGLGDTKSSMYVNLVGHWGIGLPIGLLCAYTLGLKILGIWIGLAAGLSIVALVLIFAWIRKSRAVVRGLN